MHCTLRWLLFDDQLGNRMTAISTTSCRTSSGSLPAERTWEQCLGTV